MVLLLVIGTLGDLWRAAHVTRVGLPAASGPVSVVAPGAAFEGNAAEAWGANGPKEPAPAAISKVDLNAAGVRELDALPGIGPVLAERIAEHRRSHGRFRNTDELLAVRGIGPKLFARLQPLVTVSGAQPARGAATDGRTTR